MDDSNQRFVMFENSLTVSLLSLKMTDFTSSTSSAEVAEVTLRGHPEQGSSQTPSDTFPFVCFEISMSSFYCAINV